MRDVEVNVLDEMLVEVELVLVRDDVVVVKVVEIVVVVVVVCEVLVVAGAGLIPKAVPR